MQAASIRMTPRQVALVQESFAKIVPIREQAAALFYNHLFAIDPSTRPLFRGDMKSQGAKLMAAIGAVVESLDRIDTIPDDLRTLARRHHRYGVREEHYASVGAALLWTLEQALGFDFTPDVRQACATAYDLLSGAMIAVRRTRTRQYPRLVCHWIGSIRLDPSFFGTHSQCRCQATLIYYCTGKVPDGKRRKKIGYGLRAVRND